MFTGTDPGSRGAAACAPHDCLPQRVGPVTLQAWTQERTAYLGTVLSKMLRGYTDAAVSFTSTLLSFISRFAIQVSLVARQIGCSSGPVPSAASVH